MEVQEFINSIASGAQDLHKKNGIFASLTIAQAALETGWGKDIPTDRVTEQYSYNLFGIKGTGPAGSVYCRTWEVVNGQRIEVDAQFRAYNSFEESLVDHQSLLLTESYAPVRNAKTPIEAATQLYICGYATDPYYPNKLIEIINENDLTQYDIDVPGWAQDAVTWALNNALIVDQSGSEDFYRGLTVLYRYDQKKTAQSPAPVEPTPEPVNGPIKGVHEGHRLTCIPSPHDPRDYKYEKLLALTPGIHAVSPIDYRPNLPACFDQGQRGSCVACATTWTPKAFEEINEGDFPADGLSAAYLYAMCKALDGDPSSEGTYPRVAMQVLQKYGICPEDDMQYSTLTNLPEPQVPPIPTQAMQDAPKYKIKTYAQLCSESDTDRSNLLTTIRQALQNEGPFVLALTVCDNFIPDAEGKLPLPAGTELGGHAIGIVGDLPEIGCLILRNSWGPSWGIDGYAYLPYSWLTAKSDGGWYVFDAWTATDIVIPKAASRIEITPGFMTMLVDGQIVELDQPAIVTSANRLLLPVREMAGNMGYVVAWDGQKAILTKPN